MSQHRKPCKTCPFRRESTPQELGGSPTHVFVGQAYGPFWIPCHECIDYSDPNWREQYHAAQCAGAAIYRANCHPDIHRPPTILKLEPDTTIVFATPAEFVAHHEHMTLKQADEAIQILKPEFLYQCELRRAGAKELTGQLPNPNQSNQDKS